ncbi:MAG: type I-E CRISPR-associated protein Cas5/CasD [Thermodesulfobacteriota bacterium]
MRDYLVFRVYGTLAAWGHVAVGEERPSLTHPTKSAVIGLLAGALGYRRDREERHQALIQDLGLAVLVDSMGILLTDYHTTQTVKAAGGRRYFTRREELEADPKQIVTILSSRQYRMEALYAVCVWLKRHPADHDLARLAQALDEPIFAPCLGRKSCPPGLPFEPRLVMAESLVAAFQGAFFQGDGFLDGLPRTQSPELYWEHGVEAGAEPDQVFFRLDEPLSRRRWQFGQRAEYHAGLPAGLKGED